MVDFTQKKIMIIDDNKEIREIMKIILHGQDYNVYSFPDGKSGLDSALLSPPHLILLDYFLPGENTEEIVRKLQSSSSTKNIPIVLVSASTMAKKAALEWKLAGYLAKPFQVDSLFTIVQKFIG